MSAPLQIKEIEFANNPAKWKDPFGVQITFEAHEDLPKDAEWHLLYVGSATDESCDQELEQVVIGPIKKGKHMFRFEADAPDDSKIPPENIQDITLLLLKCFYDGKMFSKIAWFVTNEYEDPELQCNKPAKPILEKLTRQIQTEDVRITNFSCAWGEEEPPAVDENVDDSDIAFDTAEKLNPDEEIEITDDESLEDEEELAETMVDLEVS